MKIAPMLMFLSIICSLTRVNAQSDQEKWDMKADFDLINRCSQAARLVVDVAAMYPREKKARDQFLEAIVLRLKETDKLGKQMPSESNLLFAVVSVETMLESSPSLKDAAVRERLLMQVAATCAIHSSRLETKVQR